MSGNKVKLLRDKLKKAGVMRAKEITSLGITRAYLTKLVNDGAIERVGHGLYSLPETEPIGHIDLIEAIKRVPHGVICLLSALEFHEIGTQSPYRIWMAIEKRWHPKVKEIPLKIVYLSGKAFSSGIEVHNVEGTQVRVYNVAKTIADCFRFRNKIGLEVAIEALRDALNHRKAVVDDVWKYAKICRVKSVIRPYLEAVVK